MSLRKPTLDEWFNAYQHRKMVREHSYITGGFTVDVSAVVADWEARGERPHFPAILARAAALTVAAHPQANRAYLSTAWGDRIVEFDGVHINFPLRFQGPQGTVLTVECLRDADGKSALELRQQIRDHAEAGLEGTRVTRLIANKPNTLFWRTAYRALWHTAWRFAMVERFGGAVAVSCPDSGSGQGRHAHFTAPTPTSMLIVLSAIRRDGDTTELDIGFTADHLVMDGVAVRDFVRTLGDLLEGRAAAGVSALR